MASTLITATRALRAPHNWAPPLARAGYVTKGIIHVLIGALAIQTIFGARGEGAIGGAETALHTIRGQPFGGFLLAMVGFGLMAYAAWRFIQALLDPEEAAQEDGARQDSAGVAKRIGWGISGTIYGSLGVAALQMAFGSAAPRGGSFQRTWIAEVLAWQFGPVLVVGAGVALILYALFEIYRAWTVDFTKKLMVTKMSASERRWAQRTGCAGLFARGVVLALVGSGVVKAGLSSSAAHTADMGAALRQLASQPYGSFLLFVIAMGLMAYGIFQFVEARYRNIPSRV